MLLSILLMFGIQSVQAAAQLKKVTNLRVESKTDYSVTLKWKDQPHAKRYQVRVMNKNGDLVYKQFTKKRSLEMTDLKADKIYQFKVRAQTGSGNNKQFGAYSKTVETRTKAAPTETDETTETGDTHEPATPILFGFWGLNGYHTTEGLADVQTRFNATVFQVAGSASNYTANTLLPLVEASGMKLTLRLTRDHSYYTTSGNFDLAKWKTELDAWDSYNIQSYIDNGTLVGHMLLDDIDTFSGSDPTAAELDEMARYSEEKFPGLMTFVRQKCNRMPTPSINDGQYIYVDNCVNQYTNYPGYSDGPIADYVMAQKAAADSLGLGVINGLNIANGGDGSSGQTGWSTGKYAMSAEEITEYGEALLAMPDVQMFLMWEYDGDELWYDTTDAISAGDEYFNQPELQAALAGLGELAAE